MSFAGEDSSLGEDWCSEDQEGDVLVKRLPPVISVNVIGFGKNSGLFSWPCGPFTNRVDFLVFLG